MIVDITKKRYVSIGTIDFSDSINEYSIESSKNHPNISKLGKCDVRVYDNEGMIPHVHIYGPGKEICVALKENKYFSHEPQHSQFNNAKQKADFDNWLRKINVKVSASDGVTYTNYQAAVSKWNKLNEHAEMDYNYPQPDYSTISQEIKNNK